MLYFLLVPYIIIWLEKFVSLHSSNDMFKLGLTHEVRGEQFQIPDST